MKIPTSLILIFTILMLSSCCKEKSECLPQHWVGVYTGLRICDDTDDTMETIRIAQGDDNFEILVENSELLSSEVCGCKSELKVEIGKTDLTFKFELKGEMLEAKIKGTDSNGIELDCEWIGTR